MATEDEQGADSGRQRPVRLSRSGTLATGQGEESVAPPPTPAEREREPEPEEVWEDETTPRLPLWTIPVAAIVLPLIGIWLLWTVATRENRQAEDDDLGLAAVPAKVTSLKPRGVAQAFLNASSLDDRLALTYRAEQAQEHAGRFPDEVLETPIRFEDLRALPGVTAMGALKYHRFAVDMPDGRQRLLCVVETPEGMRVDWDTLARHGTAVPEAPTGTARVFATAESYYNYEYSDDGPWVSYKLTNPDWEQAWWGYVRRHSVRARLLRSATRQSGETGQRVLLELRLPEGADPAHRQVSIERVLTVGWVQGEGDFEAGWELRRQAALKAAGSRTPSPESVPAPAP